MVECSADRRQPGLQLTQSHQSGSAINAGTTVVSHTKNRVGDYRQSQKPKMVSAMSRNEIKCLLVRNKTQSIALNYTDFNLPSGFSAALSPLQGVSGKRMTAPRDENKENHPKMFQNIFRENIKARMHGMALLKRQSRSHNLQNTNAGAGYEPDIVYILPHHKLTLTRENQINAFIRTA